MFSNAPQINEGKQKLIFSLYYLLLTSATTFAAIKARLRSNSELNAESR